MVDGEGSLNVRSSSNVSIVNFRSHCKREMFNFPTNAVWFMPPLTVRISLRRVFVGWVILLSP